MKLLLAVLGVLLATKPTPAKESSFRDIANSLGTSAILSSMEEAKLLVDAAYQQTQDRLNEKLKQEKVNPVDILVAFKQPVGTTRLAVKAADYLHVSWALLKEKLQHLNPRDFNITDVLTSGQMQTLYKASGCAKQELMATDCDDQSPYRTITGECNNRRIPTLGASNRPYARWLLQEYEDGISVPRGWNETKRYSGFPLPLVRAVSNEIVRFNNTQLTEDPFRSVMFMQWGQFVDHDLDFGPSTTATLTFIKGADCNTCVKAPPCFPIKIPPNDPVRNPNDCIGFTRAAPACNGGYAIRNQINALTPFLDASMVYASEVKWARELRNTSSDRGLLAINQNFTDRGLAYLPFGSPEGFPDNCNQTNPQMNIPCFFAGDNRANEMPQLTAFHTLMLREHNRVATALKIMNPCWDTEKVYQEARKLLGALVQKITYEEYLPLLLSNNGYARLVNRYQGYNDSVDPRVASIFTSAFRFGHTQVRSFVFRLDSLYRLQSQTPLEKEFFATWRIIQAGGINPILRGMMARPAKLLTQNQMVVDALRDKLFEQVLRTGLDLPSLNMQRGRDHGLPGYNAWRQFCGLSQPSNEAELGVVLRNRPLARKLIQLYGTPNNIDLWIGGVAEPLVPNGRVGPLLSCIIGKQFRNIRDGDRFWWENPGVFTPAQRQALSAASFSRIICDNTYIQQVPRSVFQVNHYPDDFVSCNAIPRVSLFPWKSACCSAEGTC